MVAARIHEYCECGAGISLCGIDDDFDLQILRFWQQNHSGPGHVDRITASEAHVIRSAVRQRRRYKAGR